jgi:hypothetical protein
MARFRNNTLSPLTAALLQHPVAEINGGADANIWLVVGDLLIQNLFAGPGCERECKGRE